MDTLDWFLAGIMVVAAVAMFYFLLPPYGALIGLVLGMLLAFVAKRRRDKARKSQE